MTKLMEIVIARRKGQEKYFKNYLKYAKKIKKEAEKMLGNARVFIFGSILKKDEVPRDIDILLISPKITSKNRSKIKVKILRKIGFFSPFEIHLANSKEFEDWYSKFLLRDKFKEVK